MANSFFKAKNGLNLAQYATVGDLASIPNPQIGDLVIVGNGALFSYNGSAWTDVGASASVTSVNGETGDVLLDSGDIPELGNLYFTDARAKTAAVVDSTAGSQTDQAMSVAAAKLYTDSAVSAEASLRSAADSTLQGNIDAEALARAGADSTLQGNIDAEALARAGADSTLQGNIDAEALARAGADSTLQGNIDAEALARAGADSTLQGNIDAEALARAAADALLIPLAQKGAAFGVASLDSAGLIPTSQIPFSAAPVTSVNSKIGDVVLSTTDVGEGTNQYFTDARAKSAAVVNSSAGSETDQAMSVAAGKSYTDSAVSAEASLRASADSTLQGNIDAEALARASADALLIPLAQKAAAGGVATLDVSGKIPSSQLPPVAITSVTVVATIAERDALSPQEGDFCVVTDVNETYIYNGSGWIELLETSGVISVNGQAGAVSLSTTEISEGSNLYYTDARAKFAAVVDSSSGSQTDQAMSVAAGKSYTDSAVSAEASLRSAADSTLQGNIDAEALARAGADSTLQGNIDAEAIARSAADTTLQGNIDAEALARAAADTVLEGKIRFLPDNVRYVAKNGSDVTGNGSAAAPYQTIQAAMNSLPTSPGSSVPNSAIYVFPGTYSEVLSWTRANTHIIGLQAPRKNIQGVVIKGGIDFAITDTEPGGMFNNVSSISNCLIAGVSSGTRNIINFNGSLQVILNIINSQVYQDSVGYSAISMNNTASSLSRLYIDNCVVQNINTGSGHAIELIKGNLFSAFNSEIYRSGSSDPSARAIKLSNNSTVALISNGQIVCDKDYVIEMAGSGNFTSSLSLIQNGTANKSGVLVAAGTVFTALDCSFNVAAGTGKAIDGSAGSVFYYASNLYLANSSISASITKIQVATDTTTSVITEGSNQYFTTARARTAAVINNTLGNETDQAPSVSALKAFIGTISTGVSMVNNKAGVVELYTDDISEDESPFNLWFTEARAQSAAVVNDATGSQLNQAPSVSAIKSYVDTSVSTEALTRSGADSTLQSNIDAEALARASADSTLQDNIDAEASARAAADALLIPLAQKAAANGVATLDGSGKIPSSQLPPLAISSVTVVATIAERDALSPQEGDFCVVTDVNETYIYDGSAWIEIKETSGVTSVNGQSGSVSLTTTQISEGSNLYYTDSRAKTAAVIDSTSGSQTDQAPSVSAIKSYVGTSVASEASLRSAADSTLQDHINSEESARIAADNLLIPLTQKAATNGVATLDGSGKVPVTQIPFDQSPVTSVNGETGAVQLDSGEVPEGTNKYFTDARAKSAAVVNSATGSQTDQAASVSAMKSYVAASSPVLSVNGELGTVVLDTGDVQENGNLYFTDARAKSAAVVNSSSGSQVDQAASVSAMKSYVSSSVSAEATLRSNADTTLQTNIDNEASARSSADSILQGNIDAEASARAAADALLIPLTQKAAPGGVATLDVSGKIPSSQLPSLAITSVTVVATIAERDALSPQEGDFCVVTGVNETYIYDGSAWIEIKETSGVTSVNGQSGSVSLSTTNISEGSNLYYTDTRAKTAAVVNSSSGSETDQAMSVSAAKSYTDSSVATEAATRASQDSLLIPLSQKAAPGGVATLDINGKILVTQLPASTAPVTSVNGQIGDVVLSTADIAESGNLYFTTTRARTAAVTNSTAGSETNVAPSVSAMKSYVASSSPVLSVNDLTNHVVLTTTEITEGTNLYFTNVRARTAAVVNSTAGSETTQAPSVSAMKDYVAANTVSGVVRYGNAPLASGVNAFSINFSDIGSTSYVCIVQISNTVDLTPRYLTPVVTAKTSSSFSIKTAQNTDTANYVANYYIIKL